MPSFSEEICFSWRGENRKQDYSEVDDVEEPVRIGTGIQHRLALAHADRRREQIIDAILIIFMMLSELKVVVSIRPESGRVQNYR